MSIQNVSACLLSWKRPRNMQRIVDNLRMHDCIDDIVIWNNNPDIILEIRDHKTTIINSPTNIKTYGRFLSAYHAAHPHIYTQDDDCIPRAIPELWRMYQSDPSCIAHGLKEDLYNERQQYIHGTAQMSFMAWGGFYQKKWLSVFDLYTNVYGKDALLCSKADRIFSILLHRKHNTMLMPIETLPGSRGPEAIWTQPEFYSESEESEKRALSLIGISQEQTSMSNTQNIESTKFVVLASPRTGSNFVTEVLNQHSSICCYNEIFHNSTMDSAKELSPKETMQSIEWRNANPLEFLGNVWKQQHGKILTGFKLFFSHNAKVINAVLQDRTVKKILIRRKNIVRQYVSFQIGLRDNQWNCRSTKKEAVQPMAIDPHELQQFSEKLHVQYARARSEMHKTGQEFHEVAYEDIFGPAQDDHMRQICLFLGISEKIDTRTSLQKQHPEPLCSLIANFDEVETALKGTAFEPMLYGDEFSMRVGTTSAHSDPKPVGKS